VTVIIKYSKQKKKTVIDMPNNIKLQKQIQSHIQ